MAYVHGSTDAKEVARLEKQADFIAPLTFARLNAPPGSRILDLATGVGAVSSRLARHFPDTQVFGVDLSPSQLAAARAQHPHLTLAQATAAQLPFRDGTFDRVHCSWLLEHVTEPGPILQEVRRVLKPGGFTVFIEVENSTFELSPPNEAVLRVLSLLNEAQRAGGGDPFIGRQVRALFEDAGFTRVHVDRPLLEGSEALPSYRARFIDEWVDLFEGLDESLGPAHAADIEAAVKQLRSLPERQGWVRYRPAIVTAWR